METCHDYVILAWQNDICCLEIRRSFFIVWLTSDFPQICSNARTKKSSVVSAIFAVRSAIPWQMIAASVRSFLLVSNVQGINFLKMDFNFWHCTCRGVISTNAMTVITVPYRGCYLLTDCVRDVRQTFFIYLRTVMSVCFIHLNISMTKWAHIQGYRKRWTGFETGIT